MMSKNVAIIIFIVLIVALTIGCTEPTVLPTDMSNPDARAALSISEDTALKFVEKHPFYNSVFMESSAKVTKSYVSETIQDPDYSYLQYEVRVYIDFSEKRYNQTTGSVAVVPHKVYVQLTNYATRPSARINVAAMDGEYDLLNYRPLMGESVRK